MRVCVCVCVSVFGVWCGLGERRTYVKRQQGRYGEREREA